MLEVFGKTNLLIAQLTDLAVDAHAAEALTTQVIKQLGVLSLASQHHGREHVGAPPLSVCKHLVGYLIGGLALDGTAAFRAVRDADARIQQAQVVIDLRDRADGRARVSARSLLVNGDRRAQTVDGVQVRLVHLAQEHARI